MVAIVTAIVACQTPVRLAGSFSPDSSRNGGANSSDAGLLPGEEFLPVGTFVPLGEGQIPVTVSEDPQTTKALAQGYGQLRIRVRWPRTVQHLPASSQTLVVAVYDPLGAIINRTVLSKPTGPGANIITDTTITVPSARHLTIWARAYRETAAALNEATHVPVAVATAAGDVRDNAILRVSLDLLYVPIRWANVTPVSPTNGGPCAVVTLSGSGFNGFIDPNNATPSFVAQFTKQTVLEGNSPQFPVINPTATPSPVPTFFPNVASPSAGTDLWVTSAGATRSSDTTILAPVPSGAVNGPLQILVDGLPAVPNPGRTIPTFTVLSTIDVTPNVTRGLATASLRTGTLTFTARATDSLGANFNSPTVTWSSSNLRVGVISSTGVFTPLIPGRTTLTVRTGCLVATVPIVVVSEWSTADYRVVYPNLGFSDVKGQVALPALSQGALTGVASNQ